MIDDYSDINGVEASCDCVPVDCLSSFEELPLSQLADEPVYGRYFEVKSGDEYVHIPVESKSDEFGFSQYVLENDLGKLTVKGDSRVFIFKKDV